MVVTLSFNNVTIYLCRRVLSIFTSRRVNYGLVNENLISEANFKSSSMPSKT